MYKLTKPTLKIDDFFDDLLTNRQSAAGKFRLGRLKAIKQTLITNETLYNNLVMGNQRNELHQIDPIQKIEIPGNTPVSEFFNFPVSITKEKLLEKLREYKLIECVDVGQTRSGILEQLEEITLADIYNNFARDEDLYKFIRHADQSVMIGAYENYLVKDIDGVGRDIYDELMLLADAGTCPYCLIGNVTTLDHYLPKAQYINYSITPINLIPCCADCNTQKSDEVYDNENKLLINAYFEDIGSISWLYAEVVEKFPVTFNFKINTNMQEGLLKDRLERQFNKLFLKSKYGNSASRYFRTRVKSIVMEYNSGGLVALRKALENNQISAEFYNLNSIEAKVYEALLNSSWFMQEETLNAIIDYYELA